jgi:hypothetical protein
MPLNQVDITMMQDIPAPGPSGKIIISDGTGWTSGTNAPVGSIVKQATDPTPTVPATPSVGDMILNNTTGQLFSCTTETAGAAVWTVIGVVEVDLHPVHQAIATLGLHTAVSANSVAFNLPDSFIDTFEDDTGIATETTVDRDLTGEYVASIYEAEIVTTPSLVSEWAGNTAGNTFSSGRVYFANGGDESIRSASTISGDFEFEVTVTEGTGSGGWVGVFLASDIGTFVSGNEYGSLKLMNNSYLFASIPRAGIAEGFTARTGGSQVVTGYSSTNGQVVKIKRVGSTITQYLDGVLKATQTGVNTGTMYTFLGGGGFSASIESDYTSITWTTSSTSTNATGTLVSDVQTAAVATTEASGVILYTDEEGTNVLGSGASDNLAIYLTANLQGSSPSWIGTNWTDVGDTLGDGGGYGTPQIFSGTTKQVKLGKTTVTSGTQVAMKAVWANQVAATAAVSGGWDSGDRTSTITVTTDATITRAVTGIVDGSTAINQSFYFAAGQSGKYLRFQMDAAKKITGIKMYNDENNTSDQGTWKWQGSNTVGGASGYVDIGSTFAFTNNSLVGGAGGYTVFGDTMSGNTTAYLYYQILQTAGTTSSASNWMEIYFNITATAAGAGKVAQLNGWAVNYGGFVLGGAA